MAKSQTKTEETKTESKKRTFRIISGSHKENGTLYRAGLNDVIETDKDLNKFNSRGSVRYVEEGGPVIATQDMKLPTFSKQELTSLSDAELKSMAEDKELDISKVKSKFELVDLILNSQ